MHEVEYLDSLMDGKKDGDYDESIRENQVKNQNRENDSKTEIFVALARIVKEILECKYFKIALKVIAVSFCVIFLLAMGVSAFGTTVGRTVGETYIIYESTKIPTIMHSDYASELITATLSIVVGFVSGLMTKKQEIINK